jgi:anti-sigma factor RsiW
MLAVSEHLKRCESCAALVTELRVVDALLATTKTVELAPNFTFAVMAEVRSMPATTQRTLSIWAVLSFYIVAAWIVLTTTFLTLGPRLSAVSAVAGHARASLVNSFSAFGGAAHAFAPSAPFVAAFVVTVLGIDLLLIAGLIVFYRSVRPRLAAQLAPSEAS